MNSGWTVFPLLFARQLIAGLLMMAVASYYKFPWTKNKKMLGHCILAGFIMWLGFATQLYGQKFTNVSETAIYSSLYALFTPFLAYLINKSKISWRVYLACFVAFVAVVLLSFQGSTCRFGWGEFLLLLCALFFALHLVILENFGYLGAVFAISSIQMLTMAFCCLVATFLLKESLQVSGLIYVFYLAIFCSGLAFLLQIAAQIHLTAATVGLLLSFESLWGVLGAVVFFGEAFTWQIGGGCLLMLLAIYILEAPSKNKN